MSYQVLARKWRPQDFSTLIGQKPVVTALRNALTEGRIAQAYLFSGIRGVGKTTVARVLAKALNCERGVAHGPCNECPPCREITAGADMDVLEIDAATYSKVEQIRDLTESLRYGPARDRYKVVVLDEVHRLSRQAFDALLKIVEEPPAHLVFVFATTEIDAVPATILSRCQEFHFRRVAAPEVAEHLRAICDQEGITASPTALRLVARAGEGSVRDAVALLDQLATFGGGTIRDEEAAALLGGLDLALFHRLLAAIVAGDAVEVLAASRRVADEGWDPRGVHAHFLAFCRDALRLALGTDPAAVDLPHDEALALAELARSTGYPNLLRLLHHLLGSETTIRRAESAALACEIAWLRAAELPRLVAIEGLLAGAPPAPPAPGGGPQRAPRREPTPTRQSAPAAPPTVDAAPPRPAEPAPAAEPLPATATSDDALGRLREELSLRRPSLAAQIESGTSLHLDGSALVITVAIEEEFVATTLRRPANRAVLDAAVAAVLGSGASWRLAREGVSTPRAAAAAPVLEPVAVTPAVQAVLDIFGGRIAGLDRPPQPGDDR